MLAFIHFSHFRKDFGLKYEVFEMGLQTCIRGGLTTPCLFQLALVLTYQNHHMG